MRELTSRLAPAATALGSTVYGIARNTGAVRTQYEGEVSAVFSPREGTTDFILGVLQVSFTPDSVARRTNQSATPKTARGLADTRSFSIGDGQRAKSAIFVVTIVSPLG